MNANQVRPLLAFWLLALAAAVITVLGLRAPDTEARGPSGSPAPVTHSGSPSLVLGGLLRAQPTASSTASSRARWSSATALEHAAGHDVGTVTARATGASPKTVAPSSSAEASAPTTTVATTTASPTGKAKPRDGSGSGTTTTTATATTTETAHGKGQGNGNGNGPGNPGKGH